MSNMSPEVAKYIESVKRAYNEEIDRIQLNIDLSYLEEFQMEMIKIAGIATFITVINDQTGLIEVEWDNWMIDYIMREDNLVKTQQCKNHSEDNIDFDNSIKEWRKNKICLENGYFKYKCNIENCNECVYSYITSHKLFYKFATDFDLQNQNHKNKDIFCEKHLFSEFSE